MDDADTSPDDARPPGDATALADERRLAVDLARWLSRVEWSTVRLLRTATSMTDHDLRGGSLLPGWTRAHVLTHLARGADSRVRLLAAASLDLPFKQYPSEGRRAEDIARGAARSRPAILADLTDSANRLRRAARAHPTRHWRRHVRWLHGIGPVSDVLPSRLQELEIHHVDLKWGYRPADWPPGFAAWQLAQVVEDLAGARALGGLLLHAADTGRRYRLGGEVTGIVTGPTPTLLAWLIGRSAGHDLTLDPPGPLPDVPAWR